MDREALKSDLNTLATRIMDCESDIDTQAIDAIVEDFLRDLSAVRVLNIPLTDKPVMILSEMYQRIVRLLGASGASNERIAQVHEASGFVLKKGAGFFLGHTLQAQALPESHDVSDSDVSSFDATLLSNPLSTRLFDCSTRLFDELSEFDVDGTRFLRRMDTIERGVASDSLNSFDRHAFKKRLLAFFRHIPLPDLMMGLHYFMDDDIASIHYCIHQPLDKPFLKMTQYADAFEALCAYVALTLYDRKITSMEQFDALLSSGETDFRHYEFTDLDLRGVDAQDKHLSFAHARFRNVQLSGLDLAGCSFEGASLRSCKFIHAKLGMTYFKDATLTDTDLTESHLNGSSFEGAHLTRCIFHGSSLHFVTFHNASLELIRFKDADLHECHFESASLKHVDFQNAKSYKLVFTDAEVSGVTNVTGSALNRSTFHGANIMGADFRGLPVDTRLNFDLKQ